MIALHKSATTTPATRLALQQASGTDRELAQQYGIGVDTVGKWRHRSTVHDASHTAHRLQTTLNATREELVVYSHDTTGALTKKGDSYLHSGIDGRIAKVSLSADPNNPQAISYHYNALGKRIAKIDARLSTTHVKTLQTVYAEDRQGSTVLGQYSNQRSADGAAPAGETATAPNTSGCPPLQGPCPSRQ